MNRSIYREIRLLRVPSSLILNVSRDGASTTSLGNLLQCLTTLSIKKTYFLCIHFFSFSLKPLPLVLPPQTCLTSADLPGWWLIPTAVFRPHLHYAFAESCSWIDLGPASSLWSSLMTWILGWTILSPALSLVAPQALGNTQSFLHSLTDLKC